METLVEIAKRIGIFPNPHMSERDWAVVRIAIGRELEKNTTTTIAIKRAIQTLTTY